MNDTKKRKIKSHYCEEELVDKLTPYLAHADELELITLSDKEFDWFIDKLDSPPEYNSNLKELIQTKAPWES